ncbi:hypothetical protein L1987_24982 [Smallanthus sonchifolius]|uniref:Uncharacterized protein n=1 Tax=Smallanthus sonchifolius TaxID=185202 RepID=A0ACB9IMJ0_9ASTR|nr:hypothetical protein L1987_24982 [Smallanthus sonchifolius]
MFSTKKTNGTNRFRSLNTLVFSLPSGRLITFFLHVPLLIVAGLQMLTILHFFRFSFFMGKLGNGWKLLTKLDRLLPE